jgi:hypothetical protein
MAAEAARAAGALDWTVKDRNGGRWGVSPGAIHLGGITLPLPIQFSPPPGRRDEMVERSRRWSEGEAQRALFDVQASFEDRVRAVRERADAQRDSARRSGGGGGLP